MKQRSIVRFTKKVIIDDLEAKHGEGNEGSKTKIEQDSQKTGKKQPKKSRRRTPIKQELDNVIKLSKKSNSKRKSQKNARRQKNRSESSNNNRQLLQSFNGAVVVREEEDNLDGQTNRETDLQGTNKEGAQKIETSKCDTSGKKKDVVEQILLEKLKLHLARRILIITFGAE